MDADDGRASTPGPTPRSQSAAPPRRPSPFPSTCWSWIAAAGDVGTSASRDALGELCQAYWSPIYALIRRRGYGPDDAADLTQDYFARLMDGRLIRAADRHKGRFRTFLHTDCAYFLADEGDRRRAQKRGGGMNRVSIDAGGEGERRFLLESREESDPQRLFDRTWALTLLDRTIERLAVSEVQAGRGEAFRQLRPTLIDGPDSRPYAEIAAGLATTVGAVQAAVLRLRRRYREALRAEIAATLQSPTPDSIDEEIRALLQALAR